MAHSPALMNYGWPGQATFCPCQFRQGVQLECRISQRVLPTEDNAPCGYCFMLSRNCRIGSNAYSISVRPPTMMWASPFIPTRRGRVCPPGEDISYRSSDPNATKRDPSVEVTADGLIQ